MVSEQTDINIEVLGKVSTSFLVACTACGREAGAGFFVLGHRPYCSGCTSQLCRELNLVEGLFPRKVTDHSGSEVLNRIGLTLARNATIHLRRNLEGLNWQVQVECLIDHWTSKTYRFYHEDLSELFLFADEKSREVAERVQHGSRND